MIAGAGLTAGSFFKTTGGIMTKVEKMSQSAKSGFTLIELSIVLVIIGLIVGGVLVGQDLIKAAQIRATVSQMEKYNAAANTFRSKYNGLPGDLASPANFFATSNSAGTSGLADGNRLIQGATSGGMNGEPAVFWGMLATAGLSGDQTTTLNYTLDSAANVDTILPPAKLGRNNRFGVLAQSGINYFLLGAPTSAILSVTNFAVGMTPTEAYQIDTKLDDGSVNTGTVVGAAAGTGPAPATYVQGTCATGANIYDIASNPNLVACVLGVRSSF